MMLRHQIQALRLILQPHSFHALEVALFERKSAPQLQRFSTQARNEWILDRISKQTTDSLKNIGLPEWLDRINVIRKFDFSDSQCFQMISEYPEILQIPPQKLDDTIQQWYSAGLKQDNVRLIISTNPMLLQVEDQEIRKRLMYLQSIYSSFVLTDLLVSSPSVMFDDWKVILDKIKYLMNVRGFKAGPIVQSCALSMPFDFIKFRFEILEKCGMYKQMTLYAHKINKYDQSQHKNPSLNEILQEDNEAFSHAVARISLEEYDVSYQLFLSEYYEDDDDDDEDDGSDG